MAVSSRSPQHDGSFAQRAFSATTPDSAYLQRFGDFVEKKRRLGADQRDSDGDDAAEVTRWAQDLAARECPNLDPYLWGRFDFVRTLLLNILMARLLAHECAEVFKGLDDDGCANSPGRSRSPGAQ